MKKRRKMRKMRLFSDEGESRGSEKKKKTIVQSAGKEKEIN